MQSAMLRTVRRSFAQSSAARQTSTRLQSNMARPALCSSQDEQSQSWTRGAVFATAAAAGLWVASNTDGPENCGIVGIVGQHEDAKEFLLEGLTILQVDIVFPKTSQTANFGLIPSCRIVAMTRLAWQP